MPRLMVFKYDSHVLNRSFATQTESDAYRVGFADAVDLDFEGYGAAIIDHQDEAAQAAWVAEHEAGADEFSDPDDICERTTRRAEAMRAALAAPDAQVMTPR